jgi:hypothetical protein
MCVNWFVIEICTPCWLHKPLQSYIFWQSILAQELALQGFVDIHRRGRGRGRRTDFTIQLSGYIDRKYMIDTLGSMIV